MTSKPCPAASGLNIRQFTMDDYDRVWMLWEICGIHPPQAETREEIQRKLARDPDLVLVAEGGGTVLGMALGAWDGRTGWVSVVAVDPRCRRMGIGSQLLKQVEARLVERGARDIAALVPKEDFPAQDLFSANDFRVVEDQILMVKPLLAEKAGTA